MQRCRNLIGVCALALAFCAPGRAQDPQPSPSPSASLGDIARQAQKDKDKDKANKPAAKVITNDDVPAASRGASVPGGAGPGRAPTQAGTAVDSGEVTSPAQGFEKLQSMLDEMDSMDRSTLSGFVLEGNNSNFPGRAKWEGELFAAKQNFVSQDRAILLKLRQLEDSASGLKGVEDPNDPRVKSFGAKLDQLVQSSQQNSAAFQAIIAEGKELAGQTPTH
jgi:hypothetical protein